MSGSESFLSNLNILPNRLLQDNYLNGQIPMELGQLTELNMLYVHVLKMLNFLAPNNFIFELNVYVRFIIRDISSNSLSGSIPESLGNLHNLTSL